MSTNKFQYWPSDGQLGSTKFTIPTNAEDWPSGDAIIGNFVYSEGELVDLVDTKAFIVNDSKSTTIPYDYVNIELPFAEDAMTINPGPRNKYLTIKFNNEEVEEGGSVIVTLKYKGCKTPEDVIAVDPDYLTNDIVDGVWSEGLGDFEHSCFERSSDAMFTNCTALTSFNSDLSNLKDGDYMFAYCENLSQFDTDLPNLMDSYFMFSHCTNLTSFSSDLSSIISAGSMFYGCSQLTSFSSDLSSLTDGINMFQGCSALQSFSSDLSNMYRGDEMFSGCTSLTSFSSDLSSLTTGRNMFANCKLSVESVENIANSLSAVSFNNELHLGVDLSSVPSTYAAVETPGRWIEWYENSALGHFIPHLQTIVDKGWAVTLNNKALEEWRYYYNPTDPT